nr:capsid protein [Picobirnavirus sp.]AVD97015.1 capsid protein [Picobirnavirus sp.]
MANNPKDPKVNPEAGGTPAPEASAAQNSLLSIAGNISTFTRLGVPAGLETTNYAAVYPKTSGYVDLGAGDTRTPCIMRLKWVPTVGVAHDATADINVAFKAFYSKVRHANSGARNYESPDLVAYTMAMDSIANLYHAGLRAYGMLNLYSSNNAVYPKRIVEAMGFDFEDWINNQPNICFYLKNKMNQLMTFSVPNAMPIFMSHLDISSKVYTDGEGDKTQAYVFVQDVYYSYEKADQAAGLTPVSFFTPNDEKLYTWAQYVQLFERLLQPLLNSEDIAMISGDIEKCYGTVSAMRIVPISDAYNTPVVKDDDILLGINNALIVPIDASTLITRDTQGGFFKCEPESKPYATNDLSAFYDSGCGPQIGANAFLNFGDVANTPDKVSAALRFHPWVEGPVAKIEPSDAGWTTTDTIEACGTEIITGIRIYDGYYDAGLSTTIPTALDLQSSTLWIGSGIQLTDSTTRAFQYCSALSKFDWHMPLFFVQADSGSKAYMTVSETGFLPFCDWQNVAAVPPETMRMIYAAIIYGSFFTF